MDMYIYTDLVFGGVDGGGPEPPEVDAGEVIAAVQPGRVVLLLRFVSWFCGFVMNALLGCVYVAVLCGVVRVLYGGDAYICRCGFCNGCEGEWWA